MRHVNERGIIKTSSLLNLASYSFTSLQVDSIFTRFINSNELFILILKRSFYDLIFIK